MKLKISLLQQAPEVREIILKGANQETRFENGVHYKI